MKIWILGKGLVGRAVQRLCETRELPYVISSHQDVDIGVFSNLQQFYHSQPDITHIINCAAYTRVDDAEKEPEEAFRVNALGPEYLGRLAAEHQLPVVHISTDYVFDVPSPTPLNVDMPCHPISIYGKTKHEGDLRLLKACPSACIVRTSWVFGKGGKNFISSLLSKLQTEKEISVVSDQINKLTSADDLAKCLVALSSFQGIFHFANQGVVSRYDVANYMLQILEEAGKNPLCEKITPVSWKNFPTPAPRPRFSILDTTCIQTKVGITPRSWELALKEYIHGELS